MSNINSSNVAIHTQLASVMEVLANAAVAEICKLVDDGYAVLRLEISQSQREIDSLRKKLHLTRLRGRRQGAEGNGGQHRGINKPPDEVWRNFRAAARRSPGCPDSRFPAAEREGVMQDGREWSGERGRNGISENQDGNPASPLRDGHGQREGVAKRKQQTAPIKTEIKDGDLDNSDPFRDQEPVAVDADRITIMDSETSPPRSTWNTASQPANDLLQWTSGSGAGVGSDVTSSYALVGNDIPSSYTGDCAERGCSSGIAGGRFPSAGSLDWEPDVVLVDSIPIKVEADMSSDWSILDHGGVSREERCAYGDRSDRNGSGASQSEGAAGKQTALTRAAVGAGAGVSFDAPAHFNTPSVADDSAATHRGAKACPQGNQRVSRTLPAAKGLGVPPPPSSCSAQTPPIRCLLCGKHFPQMAYLKRHERVHTGEKPFGCSRCGRRFSHRHQLKNHERVHTGEKPFHCTYCGKRFTQSSHMKRHLSVHAGQRPFSCSVCGKWFTTLASLIKHQRAHTAGPGSHLTC